MKALLRVPAWAVCTVAVVSTAMLGLAVAVGMTTPAGLDVQRTHAGDLPWLVTCAALLLLGALIAVRRPANHVGWLFVGIGGFQALTQASWAYAVWGVARHPGSLPGAEAMSVVSASTWVPPVALLTIAVAVFPTGRVLTRRWRWLPRLVVGAAVVIVTVMLVDLWPVRGIELLRPTDDLINGRLSGRVIWAAFPFIMGAGLAALASLVLRYRRAAGVERQQLKWLAAAAVATLPGYVLSMLPVVQSHPAVALDGSGILLPVAATLAILRYRLYDIDRIVSRTVSYALVTGVLVGVYVGCVTVTTRLLPFSSAVGIAASTLAAAALFQPVRRRVQDAVDRRFNRTRFDAVRTLEQFRAQLREQVDLDTVRGSLAVTVARTVQPATLSVWTPQP